MQTKDLQKEIKTLLTRMGWSQQKAAERLYYEQNEEGEGSGAEIRRYTETFRKKLSRSSTPPDYLEKVLNFLANQREAKAADEFKPVYVPGRSLSDTVREEMRKISREIDSAFKRE